MRKRILTVAALAAALATSLVIGSATVGAPAADPFFKVDVFITNDANLDGIFTDDEVVNPTDGEIEYRITIVNGSAVDVKILKLTDDIPSISGTCMALENTTLTAGNHVGCSLFGDPPTAAQTVTVNVNMEEAKGDESFLGIDFTTVRPATIQLFNVRINVAGSLVEGEVENLTLMVTDTSGPIAAVTIGPISAKVTGTVAEPTVDFAANATVQLTEPAKPGATFTSWSMEGFNVEGATGTQLDLDIHKFTVKLKVKKPGKEKEPAEKRQAKVEFGVLFAPLGDKFEADLDLSGEIHAVP